MNLRGKRNYYRAVVFLVVIIGGVLAFWSRNNTMQVRRLDISEFSVPEQLEYHMEKNTVCIDDTATYRGEITGGPYLAMEKGNYVFAVSYECDQAGSWCEIKSETEMDQDGNQGIVYGKQELLPEESRITFQIPFDQDVTNIEMCIYYQGGNLRINEMVFRNTQQYNDSILLYFFMLLGMGTLWLIVKKTNSNRAKERVEDICFIAGIVFLAVLPYMNDFLLVAQDLRFHLARIEGVSRALKYGQFPVRINPIQANGYGNASSIMYPQLFIYFPAILRLLGMSLMNSYKVLIFVINIMTACCTWTMFKKIFKVREAAYIGTSLYMLSCYRLGNMYIRGAVGETLALAFLPLLVWGIYEVIFGNHKKWIWLSLAFSLVFQSHILSTEIYAVLTIAILLVFIKKLIKQPTRIIALVKAGILALLLNLFTLIPLISFIREDFIVFHPESIYLPDRTIYLSQMFSWFICSIKDNMPLGSTQGEMPFSVGPLLLAGLVLFAIVVHNYKDKINADEQMTYWKQWGIVSAVVTIILLAMTLWIFPWTFLTQIAIVEKSVKMIQFLWRLLGIVSLFMAIAFTAGICMLIRIYPSFRKALAYGVCILSIIFAWFLLDNVTQFNSYSNAARVANENKTDALYLYTGDSLETFSQRGNMITCVDMIGKCTNMHKEGTDMQFHLSVEQMKENAYVEVPLYFYPGYSAKINGMETDCMRGENGVLRIAVFKELEADNEVTVTYRQPILWRIADVVSLLTLVSVCIVWFFRQRKEGA